MTFKVPGTSWFLLASKPSASNLREVRQPLTGLRPSAKNAPGCPKATPESGSHDHNPPHVHVKKASKKLATAISASERLREIGPGRLGRSLVKRISHTGTLPACALT